MKNYSSYLSLIVLLVSNSAYSMLILKQEKKHSPAYLCVQQRKLDRDPLILHEQKREGFETIITVGKMVIENPSVITRGIQAVHSVATAVIFNVATQIVTGKSPGELGKNREQRRGFDADESRNRQEREEMEMRQEKDARIRQGISMACPCFYDAKRDCFLDYDGNILTMIGGSSEKPQTNTIYAGIPLTKPSSVADKAWLEEFAHKICPSGGYTLENIPADADGNIVVAATPPLMPHNPNPKKPKDDKKFEHNLHEVNEKIQESLGHNIAEHGLEHAMEKWLEHYDEHEASHEEIKSVPVSVTKTTSHQKVPNYNSGKRIENWNKAQEVKSSPSKSSTKSEPIKLEGEKSSTSGKFSSAPQQSLQQESTPSIPKVYQAGSDTSTQSSTYAHRDPGYMNKDKTETNSSRWDYDDYSSISSNDYSSASSFSFSGYNDIGCTLFKGEDDNLERYR